MFPCGPLPPTGGGARKILSRRCIAAINSAFAAGEPSIAIDNFTFAPAEVTVKAGTKVLFVNHDDIPHLVVLENGKVRSGVGYG
jgi:plastocyanin